MIKIQLLQENISKSLNYLQKAIPSRPQLPILSSIHVKITESSCVFSATDLYFGVRSSSPCQSDGEGEMVVPGKELREIILSLPPGKISLEYDNATLTIKSGKSRSTLQCYDSDDFPEFPIVEGEAKAITMDDLERINSLVVFSTSLDQARPVLTSTLFSYTDKTLEVVGTDGFRLSRLVLKNGNSKKETSETSSLLIPAKSISEVFRISSQQEEEKVEFRVSDELKQALFIVGEVEIFVRLIEGSYPPFEKIIPTTSSTSVSFNAKELLDNIKRANIFSRDSSNIVKFSFKKNSCLIKADSPSLGTFEGELEQAVVGGDEAEIAFNSKYLLDFLQAIEEDEIEFTMTDGLKPATFTPKGQTNYQYVVMPFKVNR